MISLHKTENDNIYTPDVYLNKDKIKVKIKNTSFFKDKFGFESGIDITNDNQVLYRKNFVIKNIIFVSNLIFTFLIPE